MGDLHELDFAKCLETIERDLMELVERYCLERMFLVQVNRSAVVGVRLDLSIPGLVAFFLFVVDDHRLC